MTTIMSEHCLPAKDSVPRIICIYQLQETDHQILIALQTAHILKLKINKRCLKMSNVKSYPLPSWTRFYFYGMHGLLDEVVFTALFDIILKPEGNWTLKGYSTIFSFFIYGSCSFFVEQIYRQCVRHHYSLKYRLPMYIIFIYLWEFSCGFILRQFNACSWNYSHYRFNIMGLITLEYLPGWLLLCLWQDLVFYYLLSLRINLLFDEDEKLCEKKE